MSLEQTLAAMGLVLCLGLLIWGLLSPGRQQALRGRSQSQQRSWLGFRQRLKARFTLLRWQWALWLRRGRKPRMDSWAGGKGAPPAKQRGPDADASKLSAQREAQDLIRRLRSGSSQSSAPNSRPQSGQAGPSKHSNRPDKPSRPTQH